ncbi:DNA polymerase III subunit gamma/tau [Candidatus Saccharibacteria bacterium]|nr:DNA polymerase III subunit gamma/tau [Candidatus Saccharibacteria bacterium]
MKQALYRNYRPRSFKELLGQDHVTSTLEKALKSGKISHAYLFTGPRGVGKTSAARILAHVANDLPYSDETMHLDIIEIDAASNRRIDEIRDLREKVAIAPVVGKYKVYIIDEVHMLTREAFNALLKTLEEPPAHTIFILATTESHKLPETIISRTQRFEFKPLAGPQMVKHLQAIAKQEKIDITSGALELLAEYGTGSFRDSISYLDQLSSSGERVTEEEVRKVLGLPPKQGINDLISSIQNGDSAGLLNYLQGLKDSGVDASAIAASLAKQLRQLLIKGESQTVFVKLLKQLMEVPGSARPYDYLEICLLEAAAHIESKDLKKLPESKSLEKKVEENHRKPIPKAALKVDKPVSIKAVDFDVSMWPKVVEAAKEKAASIYTALRLADPVYADGALTLRFQFPLHQKKLTLSKNKTLILNLIEELTGQKVSIECTVDKGAFKTSSPNIKHLVEEIKPKTDHLHSISSIFGPAEVVET